MSFISFRKYSTSRWARAYLISYMAIKLQTRKSVCWGVAKPILNITYDVGFNFFVHTPFFVMQAVTRLFAIENFGFSCSPYLNSHFAAIGYASIIANQQG